MKHALLALLDRRARPARLGAGKGPSAASIDGPGSGGGITFRRRRSRWHPLGDLTEQAGFFPAGFGQEPSPMLVAAPEGRPRAEVHDHLHRAGPEQRRLDTIRQERLPVRGAPGQ